jgi:hypothetical protein
VWFSLQAQLELEGIIKTPPVPTRFGHGNRGPADCRCRLPAIAAPPG